MRYFLDTEFIEDGRTIDLVSLALVAEDGREYYAVSREFDASKASAWAWANVLALLPPAGHALYRSRDEIREEILRFVGGERPEFWGYYADYDWVALCQIFGRMVDLPRGWPKYCRDLKQWRDALGSPRLPRQESAQHDALCDARWNRRVWQFLHDGEAPGGKWR